MNATMSVINKWTNDRQSKIVGRHASAPKSSPTSDMSHNLATLETVTSWAGVMRKSGAEQINPSSPRVHSPPPRIRQKTCWGDDLFGGRGEDRQAAGRLRQLMCVRVVNVTTAVVSPRRPHSFNDALLPP